MALQKTKSTHYGINGNYWRIIQLNMNYDRLDAVIVVALYIDVASRQNSNNPIYSVQFDLSEPYHLGNYNEGEDLMKNINLKSAYKILKQLAADEINKPEDERDNGLLFFADAIDI